MAACRGKRWGSLRLAPLAPLVTLFLYLSPRHISRKEIATLGSGRILPEHRPLSLTGTSVLIGVGSALSS
ncbi:unnamed protein product [Ectocarpus sp. CCAP 1310/34]|nr:unnamed protein product [Ectocarpus sp. CCAP 1310/34]